VFTLRHNGNETLNSSGIDGKTMHSKYDAECLYLAEQDAHFPELTVEKTLNFVEGLQMRENRGTPLQLFNLAGSRNTKIGNDTIRGVSGGERKRVSIAEAYMNDSVVQCWDNSTRGLDSFTALNLVRNLREKAASKGTTIIVSLYQASQEIYDLFDKVTVLQSGRQVYFGPAKAALGYFSALGYKCPDRMSTADYLTALSHRPEAVNLVHHGNGNVDVSPGSVEDFDTAWKFSVEKFELMQQISSFERDCTPKMDTSTQLQQLMAAKTGCNT
jgi:ATP-binding cassette subfamily G (WHITE) protein 2 (PDR)